MNKWILIVCGTLAACQPTGNQNREDETCRPIDMTTVFDKAPKQVRLDEWAKSIQYVPLETNDSTLLQAWLSTIIMQDDKFIVNDNKNIYLFNKEGKFLCIIGKKGEGPEDYISASNLWANKEGIHIADNAKRVKTYGWDGKWKKTITVPKNVGIQEVLNLPDGRILGYVQNISGKEPNRIHIFRDSTVLCSIPYSHSFEPGEITMVFYNECRVFSTPKESFIKEMFNDTIYRITDENTLIPRWVVNAGKYRVPEGARYTLKDPRKNLFTDRVDIGVIGYYKGELYFTNYLNGKTFNLYYDPQKGEVHCIEPAYPDNPYAFAEGKTFVPSFISNDNKYLIGYEAQENDENPVIVLVER